MFRQGSSKALPFSARQLHSGGAIQALSSQLTTSGCKSLNLLQIVKSRFSYTSVMPLSQLAGRNILQQSLPVLGQPVIHRLCGSEISNQLQRNGAWGYIFVRTKVRCYFPRPSEVKRIKKHGMKARLSTAAGRRIIMRRILKGRHVLSH